MNTRDEGSTRRIECNGIEVSIDPMDAKDEADVLLFGRELPDHDLLFMSRDISEPRVVRAWIAAIGKQHVRSLLARVDGKVVGCTALLADRLSFSAHVGELRVAVGPSMRGHGLGRQLIQLCFTQALSLGMEKLIAHMTTDQRGAIAIFEGLGFHAEALLAGHVRDKQGAKHDLAVLSHDVGQVQARMSAYGLSDNAASPG